MCDENGENIDLARNKCRAAFHNVYVWLRASMFCPDDGFIVLHAKQLYATAETAYPKRLRQQSQIVAFVFRLLLNGCTVLQFRGKFAQTHFFSDAFFTARYIFFSLCHSYIIRFRSLVFNHVMQHKGSSRP